MKIKLEVPFYSQKDNVKKEEYKHNSCGIVCAKMILDFAKKESRDLDPLIQEGYIVGGTESAGWNHETLVRVLRNHGVLAYRQEFRAHTVDLDKEEGVDNEERNKQFRELGLEKIRCAIDNGFPVMISVKPGFGENDSDHLILVVGYDEKNFYVNDPQLNGEHEPPLEVSVEKINEYWKGLSVFTEFSRGSKEK
jgi:hypothetical protein